MGKCMMGHILSYTVMLQQLLYFVIKTSWQHMIKYDTSYTFQVNGKKITNYYTTIH